MISIHALQAESDFAILRAGVASRISIHALQAESDYQNQKMSQVISEFQSTLSKRRATIMYVYDGATLVISIHALQAESDLVDFGKSTLEANFNPRSPSGERRCTAA